MGGYYEKEKLNIANNILYLRRINKCKIFQDKQV